MTSIAHRLSKGLLCVAVAACVMACPQGDALANGHRAVASPPAVVDVVAHDYTFEAPDTISTGWTRFRFRNAGRQAHFLLLYRLPDGKTQADVRREVVPGFDAVMRALQDGKVDRKGGLAMLGKVIPAWFFNVTYRGGPGLTAPGRVSETTVDLVQPGTYLMECYVKSPDGMFHSSMGMQKQFTVTAGSSVAEPPDADITLSLSGAGIDMQGTATAGAHVVRVQFGAAPEGGFPYDVHLARLSADADLARLQRWMDWMNVGGLHAPAPATFLGGAEQMAAGSTAYMTVDLQPGRYAWISEVDAERMTREFRVP